MDQVDFEIEETFAESLHAVSAASTGNENAVSNHSGPDAFMNKVLSTPSKVLTESKADPAMSLRISQQGSAFRPVDANATGSPFRKTPMPKNFQSNNNDPADLNRFRQQPQMNAFQHHMPVATPLQREPDGIITTSPNDIPDLVSQLVGQDSSMLSPRRQGNMNAPVDGRQQHASLFSDTNTFNNSPARSDKSTGSNSIYSQQHQHQHQHQHQQQHQQQGLNSMDVLSNGNSISNGDLPALNMDPLFSDHVIRSSGSQPPFGTDSPLSSQRYRNTMNYHLGDVAQRMSAENAFQKNQMQGTFKQSQQPPQQGNYQNPLPLYKDAYNQLNTNSPNTMSMNRIQSRIGVSDPGPLPRWSEMNSGSLGLNQHVNQHVNQHMSSSAAFENNRYRGLAQGLTMDGLGQQPGNAGLSTGLSSSYKNDLGNSSSQDFGVNGFPVSSSQTSLGNTVNQQFAVSRSYEEKSILDQVGSEFGRLNPNGPTFDPQNTPTRKIQQRIGDEFGRGSFSMRDSSDSLIGKQAMYGQQPGHAHQHQGMHGQSGAAYLSQNHSNMPTSVASSWDSTRSVTDPTMSVEGGFGRQQMYDVNMHGLQNFPNSPGSQLSGAYPGDDHPSSRSGLPPSGINLNTYGSNSMGIMPGMQHDQQYRFQYPSSSQRGLSGPQTSPPLRSLNSNQPPYVDNRQGAMPPEGRLNMKPHNKMGSYDRGGMSVETYGANVQMQGGHLGDGRGGVADRGLKGSREGSLMMSIHGPKKASQVPDRIGQNTNNRQELVESPHSKSAYKDFYRQFRIKERESAESAKKYAEQAISWMPQKAVWRVKLELADMAKRKNEFDEARKFYKEVCQLQPLASQGWLEWSKMEEECGNFNISLDILRKGLKGNLNESLLTRAIKQHERMPNVEAARHLLSRLKHQSIDRVWRAIFEGALFEERAGQSKVARKFFKLLMEHVPWYGPIYYEAYKLEDKEERDTEAMDVVQKGLRVLPRYGPLWFGLLRMMERKDVAKERKLWYSGRPPLLTLLRAESTRAIRSISRELVWKVHFELAQAEERAADVAAFGLRNLSTSSLSRARNLLLGNARVALVRSLLACPGNLRWKVWLAGARLELSAGSISKARRLLCKAFEEVPPKSRSHIYLESSRVEEYAGNVDAARRILQRACVEVRTEWKVFLEAVLLEARAGDLEGAVHMAENSLMYHSGTGRLWAILVQLCHRLENLVPKDVNNSGKVVEEGTANNDAEKKRSSRKVQRKEDVFLRALLEVPKSGEVWCEGARCNMNPLLANSFDLGSAQRNLKFAIQFTPQYGDTFIEYLRLEMLCQVFLPRVLAMLGLPLVPFVRRFLYNDPEADFVRLLVDYKRLQQVCPTDSLISVPATQTESAARKAHIVSLETMSAELQGIVESLRLVEKGNLERRCLNADPNYGTAWFFCRGSPIDSPKSILCAAQDILVHDLFAAQSVYIRAIYLYVLRCVSRTLSESTLRASCAPGTIPTVSTGPPGTESKRSSSAPSSRSSSVRKQPRGASPTSLSHSIDTTTLDFSRINLQYDSPSEPSSGRRKSGGNDVAGLGLGRGDRSDGDSDLAALLAAQDDGVDQRPRESELVKDAESVSTGLRSKGWPTGNDVNKTVDLLTVSVRCSVFTSTDFVAALTELNRLVFNKNLKPEDRRKVLFGSDQILP